MQQPRMIQRYRMPTRPGMVRIPITIVLARTNQARYPAAVGGFGGGTLMALRVGHRGAAGHVTGNTLASIAKGVALGVDFVEVDVRATRDGHPVLFHDRRVDGTTDGSGAVSELTVDEMRRVQTAGGQPIPTREDALACINN